MCARRFHTNDGFVSAKSRIRALSAAVEDAEHDPGDAAAAPATPQPPRKPVKGPLSGATQGGGWINALKSDQKADRVRQARLCSIFAYPNSSSFSSFIIIFFFFFSFLHSLSCTVFLPPSYLLLLLVLFSCLRLFFFFRRRKRGRARRAAAPLPPPPRPSRPRTRPEMESR